MYNATLVDTIQGNYEISYVIFAFFEAPVDKRILHNAEN
jgi:hypothetical protein